MKNFVNIFLYITCIIQGICGNPWPMLNTATNALGLYESTSIKKCSEKGLFADPGNCSGFYSCVKGTDYFTH